MSKCSSIVNRFYGNISDKVNKICMDCLDGKKLECYGNKSLPDNFEIKNPRSTLNYYSRDNNLIQIEKYGNKNETDELIPVRCNRYDDDVSAFIDGYQLIETGSKGTSGDNIKTEFKFTCKNYNQDFPLPAVNEKIESTVIKSPEQTYDLLIFIILVLIIPIFLLSYSNEYNSNDYSNQYNDYSNQYNDYSNQLKYATYLQYPNEYSY